jgi:hypothetical protein
MVSLVLPCSLLVEIDYNSNQVLDWVDPIFWRHFHRNLLLLLAAAVMMVEILLLLMTLLVVVQEWVAPLVAEDQVVETSLKPFIVPTVSVGTHFLPLADRVFQKYNPKYQ